MILRTHRLAVSTLAALALAASAGAALADTAPAKPAAPVVQPAQLPTPAAGKGQVVFYRKPLFSLVPFNWIAREGKTEICEMVAGAYCIADVDPGTHTYEVHSEVTNKLTLEVDAGETYYVIGTITMGLIVNHPNIAPTEKAQFDAISGKLKVQPPQPAVVTTAATTATPAGPASTTATPAPEAKPAS